jgi:hypothetical protein
MEISLGEGEVEGFCPCNGKKCCCRDPPDYCKMSKEGKGCFKTYKYPHYYGIGPGFEYHYGEPFYKRFVEYPYPATKENCGSEKLGPMCKPPMCFE